MENNWKEVELSALVDYKKGKKPKRMEKSPFKNSLVYLDIRAIEKNVDENFVDAETSNHTDENDIVIVWDGARAGWVAKSRKGAIGSTLMVLKPKINRDYLFRFLQTQFHYLQTNHRGTGIPHVDPDIFWSIQVPVAPDFEQEIIANKLDELLQKIESNIIRLEKIPLILKRFRKSVLAAAMSGKLSSSKIIWEEKALATLVKKGDIFDGPFGSNLKSSDYSDKGVRVIRLENIEHLGFIEEKQTFISKEKYRSLVRHTVGEGDIIFSSFIVDEIRVCKLPSLSTKAIAKADCFCIRPNKELVDKDFLLLYLASNKSYEQLVINIHGATRPRINTTQLKKLIVLLPTIKEQKRIVQKVTQLFSFADKIEERFNNVKAQVDRMSQSVLAKAFRGELVKRDLNPEKIEIQ